MLPLLLLIASNGAPADWTVASRPLSELVAPNKASLQATWSLAVDPRGVLYAGRVGEIVVWDGHHVDTIPVPGAGVVRALLVVGDRLYFASQGVLGFLEIGERLTRSVVPIEAEGLTAPRGTTIFGTDTHVNFGTDTGALVMCPRPVESKPCPVQQLETEGWSLFSKVGTQLWATATGIGHLRLDGRGFEPISGEEAFRKGRAMFVLPGRSPNEHMVGFLRRGLFWWTPESGLRPVEGLPVGHYLLLHGRRLRDGRYLIGTNAAGAFLIAPTGAVESLDHPEVLAGRGLSQSLEVSPRPARRPKRDGASTALHRRLVAMVRPRQGRRRHRRAN